MASPYTTPTREDVRPSVVAEPEEIPSNAAIAGHPIHPMLIPFPIAFLSGALITDIVYLATDNPFWADASFWLLTGGAVSGVAAGAVGAIDYLSIDKVRSIPAARVHALGNLIALGLAGANILLRVNEPTRPVESTGIVLSAVTGALLVLTGWMGGELSYRHKVGVNSKK